MKHLFMAAGVSALLVAQGCASKPSATAAPVTESGVEVTSVSLKIGAEPSKKTAKTTITGKGVLHFMAGQEQVTDSSGPAIVSGSTCDVPISFTVTGDSAGLNAALHEAFKTIQGKVDNGPSYYFTSGFVRRTEKEYGPLKQGSLSDFYGEYVLRTDEELKKFDGGKSHLFENKNGLLFGFPAAKKLKGIAKISIQPSEGPGDESQNVFCLDIGKKGFSVIGQN
jgi:hypothetical protein